MKDIDNEARANRGGSWNLDAGDCRASYRYRSTPDFRNYYLGFRVVRRKPKSP